MSPPGSLGPGDASGPSRRCHISGAGAGEFALIRRIVERLGDATASDGDAVGPGDDAAVVTTPDGRVVASVDMFVEGEHFRLDWLSPYDVGCRVVAASVADVVAMGARPTAVLVGLGMPADETTEWADGFADGIRDEAGRAGVVVVGGDLVRAKLVTVSVTALGDLDGRAPVLRGGAHIGDRVAVAGRLGWSVAGLRALCAGDYDGPLQDAFRRPTPPYDVGPQVAALGATSMIDVSDGLAADLGHVATASGLRIDVDVAALRRLGTDGVTDGDLLTGGEDHALAFTIAAGIELPAGCVVIGRVGEGSDVYADGVPVTGGFAHFT